MLRNSNESDDGHAFQPRGGAGAGGRRKHRATPSVRENVARLAREAPGLGVIFVCKLLNAFAYFSVSTNIALFLTEEFHLNDSDAGMLYGIYGAAISVYGMLLGKYIDELGVRASMQLGFALAVLSRLSMATTSSLWVVKFNLYLVLPIADALGIPVLAVAVRRLAPEHLRSFAFGIFTVMLNFGGMLTGFANDFFTIAVAPATAEKTTDAEGDLATVDLAGGLFDGVSSHRMILLACAGASAIGLALATFGLRDSRLGKDASDNANANSASARRGGNASSGSMLGLLRDPSFLRFFAFSIIMVNLRSIFRHLDATLPKYLVRVHGETVNKGLIFSLNPIMIVILVPLVSAWTAHLDAFRVITVGAFISASSAMYPAMTNDLWAAVGFVVQLSLGESLWNPRFLDYQVSVAPEGQEAGFMALANAPLFLSKLPTGYMSGYLLQHYCPPQPLCAPDAAHCLEWIKAGAGTCAKTFCLDCAAPWAGLCDATCHFCPQALLAAGEPCIDTLQECPPAREGDPQYMWFVILVVTLISPVLLVLLQRHIREPPRDRRKQHDELIAIEKMEVAGLVEEAP
ncbi:Di-/tripeptide transporter [Hondaea fermentalgiana]|uniref:Di-/tripeptide transporter n=1 Tax=Hondaea fermentalgiana TaxID=2315210 RepID=A0A2R5GN50_9STRA|nr:Di-/tripeptide transporter [Hondaea fermentalgiana]|eukprot:GBG32332.1 Di-/tripeptide transporter [Hondaea fermentalgiana]